MKFHIGELIVDQSGQRYRVVDCQADTISLKRINGYTLFSCNRHFAEQAFRAFVPPTVVGLGS
jgi:hypothetical protein